MKRADQMRFGGWNIVERNPVHSSSLLTWLTNVTASGPVGAAIVWVVMAIGNGGISEKPGWRGYALPRLQGRMSALRAGMAAGLLMGLWHWGPDSWKLLFLGHPLLAVSLPIGTIFGTVPLGVLMAFVYNNTNGSLLLPVLFHAAINSTFTLMDLAWPQVPFYIRYRVRGGLHRGHGDSRLYLRRAEAQPAAGTPGGDLSGGGRGAGRLNTGIGTKRPNDRLQRPALRAAAEPER